MSGPSDKAVEAAARRVPAYREQSLRGVIRKDMRDKLDAAYPLIRADVIAEVWAFLDKSGDVYLEGAASAVEREFGQVVAAERVAQEG